MSVHEKIVEQASAPIYHGSDFYRYASEELGRITKRAKGSIEASSAKKTLDDLRPFSGNVAESVKMELLELREKLEALPDIREPLARCFQLLEELENGSASPKIAAIVSRFTRGVRAEGREELIAAARRKISAATEERKAPLDKAILEIESKLGMISTLVRSRPVSTAHEKKNQIFSLDPSNQCLSRLKRNIDAQEFGENTANLLEAVCDSLEYLEKLQDGTLVEENRSAREAIESFSVADSERTAELEKKISSSVIGRVLFWAKKSASGEARSECLEELLCIRSYLEIAEILNCLTREACVESWKNNGSRRGNGSSVIEGISKKEILEYLARNPENTFSIQEVSGLKESMRIEWDKKQIPENIISVFGEASLNKIEVDLVRPENLDTLLAATSSSPETLLIARKLIPSYPAPLYRDKEKCLDWIRDVSTYIETFGERAVFGAHFLGLVHNRPGEHGFSEYIRRSLKKLSGIKKIWSFECEFEIYKNVKSLAIELKLEPELVFLSLGLYMGVVFNNNQEMPRLAHLRRFTGDKYMFHENDLKNLLNQMGLRAEIDGKTHYYTTPQKKPKGRAMIQLWKSIEAALSIREKEAAKAAAKDSAPPPQVSNVSIFMKDISGLGEIAETLVRIAPSLHRFLCVYAAIPDPSKDKNIEKQTLKRLRADFVRINLALSGKKGDSKLENEASHLSPIEMMKRVAKISVFDPAKYDPIGIAHHIFSQEEIASYFGVEKGGMLHTTIKYLSEVVRPHLASKKATISDMARALEPLTDPRSEEWRALSQIPRTVKSLTPISEIGK